MMRNLFELKRSMKLAVLLGAIAAITSTVPGARAATVLFLGQPYDDAVGTGFVIGQDRVVGSITFDSSGDSQARSFRLSSTMNGGPGFEFNVPDTSALPVGVSLSSNSFADWVNGLPTSWSLTVYGNIAGSAEEEQITIDSALGDLVAFDLLNLQDQSAATSSRPGVVRVIPEPSSFCLLLPALAVGMLRRRRTCYSKSAIQQIGEH